MVAYFENGLGACTLVAGVIAANRFCAKQRPVDLNDCQFSSFILSFVRIKGSRAVSTVTEISAS